MGCCDSRSTKTVNEKFDHDPHEKRSMLRYDQVNIMSEHSDDDHTHDGGASFKTTNMHHPVHKSKHYKILLLGPGMSGKTTILKQMRKLHGQSYTIKDFMNCKGALIQNLIESFRYLCIYSEILPEQCQNETENGTILETKVSQENRHIRDHVAGLSDRAEFNDILLQMFSTLLLDDGIQETLKHRYKFQLPDNFNYLIKHMKDYSKPNYIPTYDDYLHVKQRTVGIQKISFKLPSKTEHGKFEYYDIHDAGGQRTERKKWIKVITGATAFIFVAAISGYNQSLWEEPSYNRMKEAIHLFRRIYHMDMLNKAHAILFLNKYDLFEKKISKYSFKDTFNEYKGKETPELVSQWIVNKFKEQQDSKYGIKYDSQLRNGHSNNNNGYDDMSGSIQEIQETQEEERNIYFHFTSATDTECINRVFELCRDIIVVRQLNRIGFL